MFRWRIKLCANTLVLSADHYEATEFVCDSYQAHPGLLKQHVEQLSKNKSLAGLEQDCLNPQAEGYSSLDALLTDKYAEGILIADDLERQFDVMPEFAKKELLEYTAVYVLEITHDENTICTVPYPFTIEQCVQAMIDYVKRALGEERTISPQDIGAGIHGKIHAAKAVCVNSVEANALKKKKRKLYDCGDGNTYILCQFAGSEPVLTMDTAAFSQFASWEDVAKHYTEAQV